MIKLHIDIVTPDKELKLNTVKIKMQGIDTPILIDMRPDTGGIAKRVVYDQRKDGLYEISFSQTGFFSKTLNCSIGLVDMRKAEILELTVVSDSSQIANTCVSFACAVSLNPNYTGGAEEIITKDTQIIIERKDLR